MCNAWLSGKPGHRPIVGHRSPATRGWCARPVTCPQSVTTWCARSPASRGMGFSLPCGRCRVTHFVLRAPPCLCCLQSSPAVHELFWPRLGAGGWANFAVRSHDGGLPPFSNRPRCGCRPVGLSALGCLELAALPCLEKLFYMLAQTKTLFLAHGLTLKLNGTHKILVQGML
jgi:hypothetical protein